MGEMSKRRPSYLTVIRRFFSFVLTGVTKKKLALFFDDLHRYISAGVSFYEAIGVMRRHCHNAYLGKVLDTMRAMVDAGRGLGDAISLYPETFGEFELAMVDLGEQTGKLDVVLKGVSEKLKSDHFIKLQFIRALWYPALVLVVLVCVSADVSVIYWQGFGAYMSRLGPRLFILAGAIVSIALLIKLVKATPGLGYVYDSVICSIPFVGWTVKKAAVARFALALSYGYAAGSDLKEIIRLAGRSSTNNLIEHDAMRIADELAQGVTLTDAFDRSRVMPPMLKEMVAVGEKTGDLERTLMNVVEYAKEEVKTAVANMTKLLFVAGIIILGVVVFFFALRSYTRILTRGLKVLDRALPHHH